MSSLMQTQTGKGNLRTKGEIEIKEENEDELWKARRSISNLESQIKDLTQKNDVVQKQCDDLKNQLKEKETECSSRELESQRQLKNMQDLMESQKVDITHTLNLKYVELANKLEETQNELSNKESQLQIYKNEAESAKQSFKNQTYHYMKRGLKSSEKNESAATDDVSKKDKTILSQSKRLQELQSEIEDKALKIQSLEEEISILEEQFKSTKEELMKQSDLLKKEALRMQEEVFILTTQGREKENAIKTFKEQAENAEVKLTDLKHSVSQLTCELRDLNQEANCLKTDNSANSSTIAELKQTVVSLQSERVTHLNENKKLREEVNNLLPQIQNLTQASLEANRVKEEIQRQADQSKGRLAKLEKQLHDHKNTIESQNTRISQLQDENQDVKENFAREFKSSEFHKKEVQQLKEDFAGFKSASEARERTLRETHKEEIARMSLEHNTAISNLGKRYSDERNELMTQIGALCANVQSDKTVGQDTIRLAVQQLAETNTRTNQMMQAAFRAYQVSRGHQY